MIHPGPVHTPRTFPPATHSRRPRIRIGSWRRFGAACRPGAGPQASADWNRGPVSLSCGRERVRKWDFGSNSAFWPLKMGKYVDNRPVSHILDPKSGCGSGKAAPLSTSRPAKPGDRVGVRSHSTVTLLEPRGSCIAGPEAGFPRRTDSRPECEQPIVRILHHVRRFQR